MRMTRTVVCTCQVSYRFQAWPRPAAVNTNCAKVVCCHSQCQGPKIASRHDLHHEFRCLTVCAVRRHDSCERSLINSNLPLPWSGNLESDRGRRTRLPGHVLWLANRRRFAGSETLHLAPGPQIEAAPWNLRTLEPP
jgi:hypothetical protein